MTRNIAMPTRLLRTGWPMEEIREGNERYDAICDSITSSGIREPITIDLRWFVLNGHHRLAVARHLGLEWVPVRVWTGVEYIPE